MSEAARAAVVADLGIILSADSERLDLLREGSEAGGTDSRLIEALGSLRKSHFIEITAVRTDHHDDGKMGHAGGLAFDCWPLASNRPGDWLAADDVRFRAFLKDAAQLDGLWQLGLAGSAYTPENVKATGLTENFDVDPCVFADEGADHIHIGVHPA